VAGWSLAAGVLGPVVGLVAVAGRVHDQRVLDGAGAIVLSSKRPSVPVITLPRRIPAGIWENPEYSPSPSACQTSSTEPGSGVPPAESTAGQQLADGSDPMAQDTCDFACSEADGLADRSLMQPQGMNDRAIPSVLPRDRGTPN
jgi:hypothetical protein